MDTWGQSISLIDGPVFAVSYALAGALLVALLVPDAHLRVDRRRFAVVVGAGILGGAALGAALVFVLDDWMDVFGVALTPVVRTGDVVAFAALGIAVGNIVTGRRRRVLVAVLAIILTGWCLFLTINVDFGQYRTVAGLLGQEYSAPLALPPHVDDPTPLAEWTAPDELPTVGVSGRVDIPTSHAEFAPRPGVVYLPPAALIPNPPALPVVVAMSGQPGSPADMFSSARLPSIADAIARDNNGVAPIIVVPDQLGSPGANPMCVDSPAGDTETYLTHDLPLWISQNLNVTTDRTGWTIAGFSQGGTCSIQIGAGDPEVFGSIIDVAGERVPSLGDPDKTVDVGFGGDAAAYLRAQPESILAANAPYPDSVAVFVSGENDERYTAYADAVAAAARDAGMDVRSVIAPGSAHDWNTAHFGFEVGFASLVDRWGIRR